MWAEFMISLIIYFLSTKNEILDSENSYDSRNRRYMNFSLKIFSLIEFSSQDFWVNKDFHKKLKATRNEC